MEYIRPFGRFPVRTNPKILIFPFLRGRDSLLGIFTSSPTDRSEISFREKRAKGSGRVRGRLFEGEDQERSRSARISAKTASFWSAVMPSSENLRVKKSPSIAMRQKMTLERMP